MAEKPQSPQRFASAASRRRGPRYKEGHMRPQEHPLQYTGSRSRRRHVQQRQELQRERG